MDEILIASVVRAIATKARRRAAKSGITYSLPDGFIPELFDRQRRRCDVTGQPFSMLCIPEAFVKHPFAPSLDRRDSQGGYTVENVRLVFVCVNFGLGQWGQEVYLHCARAAVEHDREVTANLVKSALPPTQTNTAVDSSSLNIAARTNSILISDWSAKMQDRIDAADLIAQQLAGLDLARQKRHIASLKRNLKLGPEGLWLAAHRAAKSRKKTQRV